MYLATRIVNRLSGMVEFSGQQAAAALLGMPASMATTGFAYAFPWAALSHLKAQAQAGRLAGGGGREGEPGPPPGVHEAGDDAEEDGDGTEEGDEEEEDGDEDTVVLRGVGEGGPATLDAAVAEEQDMWEEE